MYIPTLLYKSKCIMLNIIMYNVKLLKYICHNIELQEVDLNMIRMIKNNISK